MSPKNKKIAIIGAGGIGSPLAYFFVHFSRQNTSQFHSYEIDIFDFDKVEISNLNRQIFFGEKDIKNEKATVLCNLLNNLEPEQKIKLRPKLLKIHSGNIKEALTDYEYVFDCTDSAELKNLTCNFCLNQKINYIYCGAIQDKAESIIFPFKYDNKNSLEELFGKGFHIDCNKQNCQLNGIYGPVAGISALLAFDLFINHLANNSSQLKRNSFCGSIESNALKNLETPFEQKEQKLGIKTLDLRKEKCPNTFLYSKVALEKLDANIALKIIFSNLESFNNVLKSLKTDKYLIRETKQNSDENYFEILATNTKKQNLGALSKTELQQFSRQLVLSSWGELQQITLKNSKIYLAKNYLTNLYLIAAGLPTQNLHEIKSHELKIEIENQSEQTLSTQLPQLIEDEGKYCLNIVDEKNVLLCQISFFNQSLVELFKELLSAYAFMHKVSTSI